MDCANAPAEVEKGILGIEQSKAQNFCGTRRIFLHSIEDDFTKVSTGRDINPTRGINPGI
jgi:hypothetical protein